MHTQSRLLLPLNAKRETFAFRLLAALNGKVSAKQSFPWQAATWFSWQHDYFGYSPITPAARTWPCKGCPGVCSRNALPPLTDYAGYNAGFAQRSSVCSKDIEIYSKYFDAGSSEGTEQNMLVEVAYFLYLGVQLFDVKETEAYFNDLDIVE